MSRFAPRGYPVRPFLCDLGIFLAIVIAFCLTQIATWRVYDLFTGAMVGVTVQKADIRLCLPRKPMSKNCSAPRPVHSLPFQQLLLI